MINRRKQPEATSSKPGSLAETLGKALTASAVWKDKDEFLDVVYWMRQILGLIMGLLWGVLSVKGVIGLALFFAINTIIVYVYANSFQKVDEEEFGGITELLKEGLMTSFATFLISWIILYSALYFD